MSHNIKTFSLLLIFLFFFAQTNLSLANSVPKVSNISPNTVSPGQILTISGQGFSETSYKLVVAAFHVDKRLGSTAPDFILPIVSINDNQIQAKVPTQVYNATFNLGVFAQTGDSTTRLTSFGQHREITVTGAQLNRSPAQSKASDFQSESKLSPTPTLEKSVLAESASKAPALIRVLSVVVTAFSLYLKSLNSY